MEFLALLISVVAIVIACLAYQRSGGTIDEVKDKIEDLGISMDSMKAKTADLLNACEKKLRGEDRPPEGPSDRSEPPQGGVC